MLEALPGAIVNVELKARPGRPDAALARAVAAIVAEARAEARVLVSSFDFELVAAFRQAAPGVATGLLFEASWRWWPWWIGVPPAVWRLRPSSLNPDRRLCSPARLARWVASPRAVMPWTVDDPAEVAQLARAGVAGLICNAPGEARAVVRRECGA